MLIQQRQTIKKVFPNFWDISVGGCVCSGEDSWQGAERELFEEIGVKYDFSKMLKLIYNFLNIPGQINDLESKVNNCTLSFKNNIFEFNFYNGFYVFRIQPVVGRKNPEKMEEEIDETKKSQEKKEEGINESLKNKDGYELFYNCVNIILNNKHPIFVNVIYQKSLQ